MDIQVALCELLANCETIYYAKTTVCAFIYLNSEDKDTTRSRLAAMV